MLVDFQKGACFNSFMMGRKNVRRSSIIDFKQAQKKKATFFANMTNMSQMKAPRTTRWKSKSSIKQFVPKSIFKRISITREVVKPQRQPSVMGLGLTKQMTLVDQQQQLPLANMLMV